MTFSMRRSLILKLAALFVLSSVFGCRQPSSQKSSSFENAQEDVVSRRVMSKAEADVTFKVLKKVVLSHKRDPAKISDEDVEQIINIAEKSGGLSSPRDVERANVAITVLCSMATYPQQFRQRIGDVVSRILTNPRAESLSSPLISRSFAVLQCLGDKRYVPVILPYTRSKDKVTARLANLAINGILKENVGPGQ